MWILIIHAEEFVPYLGISMWACIGLLEDLALWDRVECGLEVGQGKERLGGAAGECRGCWAPPARWAVLQGELGRALSCDAQHSPSITATAAPSIPESSRNPPGCWALVLRVLRCLALVPVVCWAVLGLLALNWKVYIACGLQFQQQSKDLGLDHAEILLVPLFSEGQRKHKPSSASKRYSLLPLAKRDVLFPIYFISVKSWLLLQV